MSETSLIHESGFPITECRQPMRISLIIDKIELEKKPANYIAVIEEIAAIIEEQCKFVNVYQTNSLTHECLLYLPQYNNFKKIHENTIWYLSDKRELKKRECSLCTIN